LASELLVQVPHIAQFSIWLKHQLHFFTLVLKLGFFFENLASQFLHNQVEVAVLGLIVAMPIENERSF